MPGMRLLIEADDKASSVIQRVETAHAKLERSATDGSVRMAKSGDQLRARWSSLGNAVGGALVKIKSGIDHANRSARDFVDRMGKDFQKLATITALSSLSFAGQSMFIKSVTKAADDQAVAVAKLESSLKAEQRTRTDSIKALTDQASALQLVTKFSDEQTIAAQAQLAAMGRTTDEILTLTPAIQDLTTFLQRAGAEGGDMTSVTMAIGKAMNGQVTALQRYVGALKIAEGETLTAEKIMELLASKTGLARVEGASFGGQMIILKNQIGEVQEAVGGALIPVIIDLVDRIKPIVKGAAEWAEEHQSLVRALVLGGAAMAGVLAVLTSLALIIGQLPAIIAVATGPIGIITFAFTALAVAVLGAQGELYKLPSTLDGVQKGIQETTQWIDELKEYQKKLTSESINAEKVWVGLKGGALGYAEALDKTSKTIAEAEERLRKLRETSAELAGEAFVGPAAPKKRPADDAAKQATLEVIAFQKAHTRDWLAARLSMIETNYRAEESAARGAGESVAAIEVKRLTEIRSAHQEHERALREMREWRTKIGLEPKATLPNAEPRLDVAGKEPSPYNWKAEVDAAKKAQDLRVAYAMDATNRIATGERAWLGARMEQINLAYEAEFAAAEGNAVAIMEARIARDAAFLEARLEHEDAFMERWMENNLTQAMAVQALGDTYDQVLGMVIQKEESGARIREALFMSFRKTFIGGWGQMMKAWVTEQIKAALIGDSIARKSAMTRKLAEAKIGAVRAYQAFAGIPIIGPALGAAAAAAAFGFLIAFQKGGKVPGVSRGRDSVPSILEPSEYVIRRKSAERIGTAALDRINETGNLPSRVVAVGGTSSTQLVFQIGGGRSRREVDDLRGRIIEEVVPILEDLIEDGGLRGDMQSRDPFARRRIAA